MNKRYSANVSISETEAENLLKLMELQPELKPKAIFLAGVEALLARTATENK